MPPAGADIFWEVGGSYAGKGDTEQRFYPNFLFFTFIYLFRETEHKQGRVRERERERERERVPGRLHAVSAEPNAELSLGEP